MVLAEQLVARVLGDLAELVVDVGDDAAHVGRRDDRRLIERVADLLELVGRGLDERVDSGTIRLMARILMTFTGVPQINTRVNSRTRRTRRGFFRSALYWRPRSSCPHETILVVDDEQLIRWSLASA